VQYARPYCPGNGWAKTSSCEPCGTPRARPGSAQRRNDQTLAKLRWRMRGIGDVPMTATCLIFGGAGHAGVDIEQIEHKLFALVLWVFQKMPLYRGGLNGLLILIN
jgi:hypothetical protein